MKIGNIRLNSLVLSFRQKVYLILFISISGIGLLTSGVVNTIIAAERFNDTVDIKTRPLDINVQTPAVWLEKRQKEVIYVAVNNGKTIDPVKEELTEEDKVELMRNTGYYKILSGIRILESSDNAYGDGTGHHVDCNRVGMSNEFGFDALSDYCFSSFEESIEVVTAWIEKHLSQMNLNQMLCFYNTGTASDVCAYSRNFHLLREDGRLANSDK